MSDVSFSKIFEVLKLKKKKIVEVVNAKIY